MKTKIVAWLCFLSIIVTLSGCNKASNQRNGNESSLKEGSYVEHEIEQPILEPNEMRLCVATNTQNQVVFYTGQFTEELLDTQYNCYTLVDGKYEKSSIDWANKAASDFRFIPLEYCQGQDGYDYILYMKSLSSDSKAAGEDDKFVYGIVQETNDSKGYVDVTPSYWGQDTYVRNLQVTRDQILCYEEDSSLIFYDTVKKGEVDYGDFITNQDYIIKEDNLYYIPVDTTELQVVQLKKDKSEKIALQGTVSNPKLLISPDGDITILDKDGVHIYRKDGTMWETIVDGSSYIMSIPTYDVIDFILLPGEYNTYYVIYRNQTDQLNERFVEYQYDATATGSGKATKDSVMDASTGNDKTKYGETENTDTLKGELNIYSLWDNATLRQAVSTYTRVHPEVKINYTVAITDIDEVYESDVIRAFNTEILSGDGADIILMDGLPLSSYIQKGVLMDLSECFSKMQEESSLLSNISNYYKQGGKIYCMPMKFYMPIYAMSKDIFKYTNSVEDLANYCKSSDQSLMDVLSYKELVQIFLYTYSDEIFSEDGQVNEDKLSSFLSSMNVIAKQIGAKADGSYGWTYGYTLEGEITNYRIRKILSGSAPNLLVNNVDSAITFVGDWEDFHLTITSINNVKGTYYSINDTFVPNGLIGINKITNDSELAKDFVLFLFNQEIQSMHLNDGLPVNEKALESWIQEPLPMNFYYGYCVEDKDGNKLPFVINPATMEEKQRVGEEVRTLTKPVYSDFIGMDMITSGAVEYLKGEKTLEQAVSDICQKVNLYLNE